MASQEGPSAAEVERRLGLSVGNISRWKKQLQDKGDEVFPDTGHLSDRDEEIRRLRRVSCEDWRIHYNRERPQSKLGYLKPESLYQNPQTHTPSGLVLRARSARTNVKYQHSIFH